MKKLISYILLFSMLGCGGKKDAESYYNRGVNYGRSGKSAKAVESFKEAIRMNPVYLEAYVGLGMAYGGMERHDDAIASFKQALAINPDYIPARYYMAIAYLITGNKDEASRECEIIKDRDKNIAGKLLKLMNNRQDQSDSKNDRQ